MTPGLSPVYAPPAGPVEILHADAALVVANKPGGLLSVPGRGAGKEDCLAARIGVDYPDARIVHRLDMETSGLIVLARGAAMHRALSLAFQERRVTKRYIAVVDGLPLEAEGTIDLPLIADWPNRPRQKVDHAVGKPSLTRWRLLERDRARRQSRLALMPETGRSHQLRVHLAAIGHAILGDPLYAPAEAREQAPRLMLHADFLAFVHPASGRPLALACPPPF